MQIKSLNQMEKIVNSLYNVYWDGWDLLVYKRNNAGFLKTNGAFKNGRWWTVTRIPVTRDGWSVPSSWARVAS